MLFPFLNSFFFAILTQFIPTKIVYILWQTINCIKYFTAQELKYFPYLLYLLLNTTHSHYLTFSLLNGIFDISYFYFFFFTYRSWLYTINFSFCLNLNEFLFFSHMNTFFFYKMSFWSIHTKEVFVKNNQSSIFFPKIVYCCADQASKWLFSISELPLFYFSNWRSTFYKLDTLHLWLLGSIQV